MKEMKLFSGRANRPLAEEIAKTLKTKLGKIEIKNFADGETYVNVLEQVRGYDVFLIQPTSFPADSNLMELLIMIDACKRASAARVTAVIPYFGYSKQDRKANHREPITAKLAANLITAAGADGVFTMDLHSDQIQGFFDIRLDFLYASQIIVDYVKKKNIENLIVVAPDLGSSRRARSYAKRLNAGIALIDKRRPKPNVAEVLNLIGDVKGKSCLIVDDEINTGGTIVNAANAVLKHGAKEVFACCTHAVFAGDAVKKLEHSPLKEIIVTNTIALPQEKRTRKVKVLSVAPLIAASIKAIHTETSVSSLLNPAK